MKYQLIIPVSTCLQHYLTSAAVVLSMLLLSGSLSAQSLYLDFEPPDADVRADNSTQYQYYEGGKKFRREVANDWGFGQLISEGRRASSPNCLQVVQPADSRQGATNRMEWKFDSWPVNKNKWSGFSIKFDNNYPTPLEGEQVTMFAQLKNSGSGAQVKYYLRNKPNATDPLEFYCQIQYGQSSSNRTVENIFPGTILPTGEWIDVVSNYKINPNQNDSFIKIWINGVLVIDYSGKIGFAANQGSGSQKVGLYGGSQSQLRKMCIDEFRVGTSYAEVDPAQGGSPSPPNPTAQQEAEGASGQSDFGPFEVGSGSNASGGQYIHAPDRNSRSNAPSSGRASYSFNLAASGDATLTARVLAPSTSDNSFWYRIDGGTWQPWSISTPSGNWQEVSRTVNGLSAGNHTLTVTYREGGTQLDWFEVGQSIMAQSTSPEKVPGMAKTPTVRPETALTVYPNPASGVVHLNYVQTSAAPVTITWINLAGKPVAQRTVAGVAGVNRTQWNTHALPKGLYHVSVQQAGQRTTQKLLIE